MHRVHGWGSPRSSLFPEPLSSPSRTCTHKFAIFCRGSCARQVQHLYEAGALQNRQIVCFRRARGTKCVSTPVRLLPHDCPPALFLLSESLTQPSDLTDG